MSDYEQPSAIIHVNGPPLTGQQAAEIKKRFLAALGTPAEQARAMNRALLRTLPLKTRLRLRCMACADHAAIWLCDRGRSGTAQALWRVSGLWQAKRRVR